VSTLAVGAQLRARRSERVPERARRMAIGALAVVVVLAAWQVVGDLGLVRKEFIGTPLGTLSAGGHLLADGELWSNAQSSLLAFAIGFGISIAIGVPLGLLMGWSRISRELAQAPILMLYVTPRLALLPVIVVWLGIATQAKVVVVVIGAVIPIVINTMAGVRDVDPRLIQVARSFGAGRLGLFTKILLPSATPLMLAGVRLAVGSAVLGVVIAELYVSTSGIGDLISTYGQSYDTDYVVFLVLLTAVFGWAVSALVQVVERRVERWRA